MIDPATIEEITNQWEKSNRRFFPTPLQTAALIDEPAMVVEIAIDRFTTWPDSWHPRLSFPFNDFWFWRAITWPIYALPLWWLAGRAMDALRNPGRPFRRPRIRLVEALIMGLIGVGSLIIGIGLFVTIDAEEADEGFRWILAPCLLWFFLGTLPSVALLRKKRLRPCLTKIEQKTSASSAQ